MARYSTVIFDLDGTLLDTLSDLADSVNYALVRFGYGPRTLDEIRSFVGNGVGRLVERAMPEGAGQGSADKVLAEFRRYYAVSFDRKTRPYSGILPLLENLKSEGVKTAIVSNKPDNIVKELWNRFFAGTVNVAVGETAGLPRKPAPDMVFNALAQLGAASDGAVYVGDSEVDIKTAANAGIDCISVQWGFRDRQTLTDGGAKAIAENVSELSELLGAGGEIQTV